MDIRLNFINQTNIAGSSDVVVFKDNAATYEPAFVWRVLQVPKGGAVSLFISETDGFDDEGCLFEACSVWVGVMQDASQGSLIDSSNIPGVTCFSLLNIASADIVIIGGGGDSEFYFNLENVVIRK